MDFLGGPIGWIITFLVGVVLGAAFVNWRMLGAQRAIAEELAAARARIEEREAASTEIEMRAKLFAQEAEDLPRCSESRLGFKRRQQDDG